MAGIGVRLDEYLGTDHALEKDVEERSVKTHEIESICHDATVGDRERAYRRIWMFLLPGIWNMLAREGASLEIANESEAFPHKYTARRTANAPMTSPAARK